MSIKISEVITLSAKLMKVSAEDITDVSLIRQGMTNRSYKFSCRGSRYIIRLPGEGTNFLINRRNEAEVYRIISGLGICDDPVYINPENGIKIMKFIDGVRTCDPHDISDVKKCMSKLRDFHAMGLKARHSFDIFGQIDFYESLRKNTHSVYSDYDEVKVKVFSLRKYIAENVNHVCLAHIDSVPDNFLFYTDECGNESLQLTDWEYSGMQDPHADIAMFCIYSLYSREETDRVIDIYFEGSCDEKTRTKIYAYIAACGLLWSNWCEYKSSLGVNFGDYASAQYEFAREYSELVISSLRMKHRVKHAIIMAAGEGKRLRPVTLKTPKPLVKVNGIRIIDTIIRGLHANGINEIYIVTGYMKEKFLSLEKEYPGVKLIENTYYNTCNNISSLYVAREYISEAIIIDGDQIIRRPEVLSPDFECSCYNAVYTEDKTDEWLLNVSDGKIKSCSRTGGREGWQLYSISMWTKKDGERLKHHIEKEFAEKHNTQIYWDDIALFVYPQEYHLGIKEMKRNDVTEIDTLDELAAIDRKYCIYSYRKKLSEMTKKFLSIIDPSTTIMPFVSVLTLCILFVLYPQASSEILGSVRNFLGDRLGTFYLAVGLGVFLVSLWIAFSDIGRIVLGKSNEKPQYSFWKWGAMIFTCGLAADILFYSFCEWIYYAQEVHVKSLGSIQDWASTFPLFHWGLIPWSFYAVLSACFGFMLHIRGVNRQKYSEACRPLLGSMTDKAPGKIIDILAVSALIAGTATTFSVATPLLSMSIGQITGWGGGILTILILVTVCVIYTVCVIMGIKGVSWLADMCMYLFFALLAYVFIFGGNAVYIIDTGFAALGNMFQNFIVLSTWTDALRTSKFPQNWTIFFWAYWMVWCVASPFFMGSISRGRTIRQVILGTYIFGVSSTLISFIVLGNYGLCLQMTGQFDILGFYSANEDIYATVIALIRTLPFSDIFLAVLSASMTAFYATSFDSITLVASAYSYRKLEGGKEAGNIMKTFWAVMLIMLPIALIFSKESMQNLQTVSIIAAFPVAFVIIIIIAAFIKDASLLIKK